MKLVLPYLPPITLSPNWKPFKPSAKWVLKEARDQVSNDVFFLAKQAMMEAGIEQPFKSIVITYTFICPANRSRDSDNWVSRMKSAQDALVLVGVVVDDTHDIVKVAEPVFVVEKGRRETIIEIEEVFKWEVE